MNDQQAHRDRLARAGELCECGRPAVVVYVTEKFGEVPYCGVPYCSNPDGCRTTRIP